MLIPSTPIIGWSLVGIAAVLLVIAGFLHLNDRRIAKKQLRPGRTVYRQNPETIELEEITQAPNGSSIPDKEPKSPTRTQAAIRIKNSSEVRLTDNTYIGPGTFIEVDNSTDVKGKRNVHIDPTKKDQ